MNTSIHSGESAACLLAGMFLQDRHSRLWFKRNNGEIRRIEHISQDEINQRRDGLLGKDFRLTIPDFPAGAFCSWPRVL